MGTALDASTRAAAVPIRGQAPPASSGLPRVRPCARVTASFGARAKTALRRGRGRGADPPRAPFMDVPASLFRPTPGTPLRARDRIVRGTSVDRAAQGSGASGWSAPVTRSRPQPLRGPVHNQALIGVRHRHTQRRRPRPQTRAAPPFLNRPRSLRCRDPREVSARPDPRPRQISSAPRRSSAPEGARVAAHRSPTRLRGRTHPPCG